MPRRSDPRTCEPGGLARRIASPPRTVTGSGGEPTRASPATQRGRASRGPTPPRRVRFRPPSRHLRRTLRCLSQPTQCQTLRSGQGDAAPPLNPQLTGPLPGQRAAARLARPPAVLLALLNAGTRSSQSDRPEPESGISLRLNPAAPTQDLLGSGSVITAHPDTVGACRREGLAGGCGTGDPAHARSGDRPGSIRELALPNQKLPQQRT